MKSDNTTRQYHLPVMKEDRLMPAPERRKRDEQKADSLNTLRRYLEPGGRVYLMPRHVSRSGTMRVYSVFVIANFGSNEKPNYRPQPITSSVCLACGLRWSEKHEGVQVQGYATDIAESIGEALFGDRNAIKGEKL